MRYVAAYLLLTLAGAENISVDDIKKVIAAGNGEADDAEINRLLGELKGKNLEEVLAAGKKKLAAVPSAPAAAAPAAAAGGAAPAAEAPKKEEKKKEEKPESEDMGFDLFG